MHSPRGPRPMTLEQILDTLSTLSAKTSVTHSDLDTLADCHDAIVQDLAAQMAVLITGNRVLTLQRDYWKTTTEWKGVLAYSKHECDEKTVETLENLQTKRERLIEALKAEGAEP